MASLNPIAGTLGAQRAAHLLRRTTFGPSRQDIAAFAGLDVSVAVNQLLTPLPLPPPPVDPLTGQSWVNPAPGVGNSQDNELMAQTIAWWMNLMKSSGNNITERMVYFYHTHIPTILSRLNHAASLYYQIALYRYYALGNYKELTRASVIDNAMLVHLDGILNVYGLPQENFAREFLELFTVGKGPQLGPGDYTTFTEQDVQAATKVLTGWNADHTFTSVDPVTNIPRGKLKGNGVVANQHDSTTKTFSPAFQNTTITPNALSGGFATVQAAEQELTDLVNTIFNAPATSLHFCRKLYRFFMYWEITQEVESDIIVPLAQTLVQNNYNVVPVLNQLFRSEHFYDLDTLPTSDNSIGAIIKSPLDLVIGTWRSFKLPIPDAQNQLTAHYETYFSGVYNVLTDMGQEFYEPYDVAGYDAYHQFPGFNRNWISANYLANRYKFAENIITTGVEDQVGNVLTKLDVVLYVKNNISAPGNATTLVQELTDLMFPIQINTQRFNFFRDTVLLDTLTANNWQDEWDQYIFTNVDSVVRVQLEKLFIALMECPEYQLL